MHHSIPRLRPVGPLLAAVALAALSACARKEAPPPPLPAPKVEGDRVVFPSGAPQLASLTIETVEPRKFAITHLTGRLYWDDNTTVRIFTPLAGRVVSLRVDVGDRIAAGAPLAEISSPDFGQALADARTAAGNLAVADKALARSKDLLVHGSAAQKDVEAAEAAFTAARAERDRAVSKLVLYGGDLKQTGETYLLRSPLAGTVVERNITPGEEVRSDQMLANAPNLFAPLFVVSDPDRLWLQLDIAETDLASLHEGQKLRIYAKSIPDRVFSGTVDNIGPSLDPATRTARVRGIVANPDGRLKAEMYVGVDAVQDEAKVADAGIEVPSKAIFTIDDQCYLFVEEAPGAFRRRQVRVGTEKDESIPVFSGVAAGEKVVTGGALLLQAVLSPAD